MATRTTAGQEKFPFERQRIKDSSLAELVHRRPDVIKELYFHHRFQPARGHAYGASHNVGFGQGRVENTVSAKTPSANPPST